MPEAVFGGGVNLACSHGPTRAREYEQNPFDDRSGPGDDSSSAAYWRALQERSLHLE
ncbi:MAG: hypothetical protein ACXWC3_19000 [Burkholderiales bacterium]